MNRERERERGKLIKLRNLNLQTMNNIFLKQQFTITWLQIFFKNSNPGNAYF